MKCRFVYIISICITLFIVSGTRDQTCALAMDGDEKSALHEITNLQETTGAAGDGKTVLMARADWDTDWFQAEIFKLLLEKSEYTVTGPTTMNPRDFYLSAARGEIDLWVNGWFPNTYFEDKRIRDKVEAVGFEVKAGALQGYLIDKKSADIFGITNLEDFQAPKIARIFDQDGNGKADRSAATPVGPAAWSSIIIWPLTACKKLSSIFRAVTHP